MERRIITTEATEEDVRIETTLRPQCLSDYVGQEKIKSTLKIYIEAAKSRGEALDHVLFYGPPRTWKDHPFRYHCQRDGKQAESDQRAGH